MAIGLLRQQLAPNNRIGLFVPKGGDATNMIPHETIVECEVRAVSGSDLDELYGRVTACFEAGALASGTTFHIDETEPTYAAMQQDPTMADLFAANSASRGRERLQAEGIYGGSSDMGNVSEVVPSIHPWVGITGCHSIPHDPNFAGEASSPAADDNAIDGALTMAATVIDVATDQDLRARYVEAHCGRPSAAVARNT